MEFTVGLDSPFSLEYTLESGQVFRWENKGEWWYGVAGGGALKVAQEGDSLRCISSTESLGVAFVRSYFRFDDDFQTIMAGVMKDDIMRQAGQRFYGLRIIKQDFWECLGSFVLATNTNIPRIRRMVQSVCSRFGEPFDFEGIRYWSFPSPGVLADATVDELRESGLGYRAPFLKHVAQSVALGEVDPGELALMEYPKARETLTAALHGVGPKVADCVLLYGCARDEAFPIDVWIARAIARWYPHLLPRPLLRRLSSGGRVKIAQGDYSRASSSLVSYFGAYAGFAQQYLFMLARSGEAGT